MKQRAKLRGASERRRGREGVRVCVTCREYVCKFQPWRAETRERSGEGEAMI